MGNTESNPVRNMDKRTARREYHEDFAEAIARYREHLPGLRHRPAPAVPGADGGALAGKQGDIVVCVRKRPLNAGERGCGEFDVVTALADSRSLVVHDARMGSDMKSQYIEHYPFRFHRAFGERDGNETVYLATAAPLIHTAFAGRLGTCIMYGQTGSGKTYTMTSFYQRISEDIFARIEAGAEVGAEISASFVEVAGDGCLDLFNHFAPLDLLQTRDGGFMPFPAAEPRVDSAAALLALIAYGCGVRSTAATGVHGASSRSHAVLKIYVRTGGGPGAGVQEGVLSLIDLAGTGLCYAMLCYAMLCCAVLCYAVLCCAMLCCAMLCCAQPRLTLHCICMYPYICI
jgi:kinesin family protein 2/24